MRRREAGFGYEVDAMAVVASTGVLAAVLLPAVSKSPDKTAVTGTLILLGISGLVGTLVALARGWHGLGFILALGQWAGAALGLGIAAAIGLPDPAWYFTIAGASIAGIAISLVIAEVAIR